MNDCDRCFHTTDMYRCARCPERLHPAEGHNEEGCVVCDMSAVRSDFDLEKAKEVAAILLAEPWFIEWCREVSKATNFPRTPVDLSETTFFNTRRRME